MPRVPAIFVNRSGILDWRRANLSSARRPYWQMVCGSWPLAAVKGSRLSTNPLRAQTRTWDAFDPAARPRSCPRPNPRSCPRSWPSPTPARFNPTTLATQTGTGNNPASPARRGEQHRTRGRGFVEHGCTDGGGFSLVAGASARDGDEHRYDEQQFGLHQLLP